MKLDLDAIKARCEALDERMGKGPWTLEGPNHYGLFSVYDGDGNVISHDVEEKQAFVAHAHADVPALVAEVERLRAEVEHLRVLMPSVDLLRCLADYTDSATDSQHHYQPDLAASGIVAAREARALAHHIDEEIQAND